MNPRPLKILHVLNRARLAGTERHVLQLAQRLDRRRFDISVACLEQGPLVQTVRDLGIQVQTFPRRHRGDLEAALRLFLFIKRGQFDIVHGHGGQLAGWLARLAGVPVRLETRHGLRIDHQAYRGLTLGTRLHQRLKVALSDNLVTVSETDRKILIGRFGARPEQVLCIHNGVDVAALSQGTDRRDTVRNRLGLSPGQPLLGTVARLTPQKGLIHLVDAVAQIRKTHEEVRCLLIGEGPDRKLLERRIQSLQLGETVTLVGHQEDVAGYLHALDLFLLPSLWEGMPYALIEAMAVGLPVVTTRIFGMEEFVTHGVQGLLVPPQDPGALADAAVDLLSHPDRARTLGQAAKGRVQAEFSLERMIARLTDHYLALVDNTKGCP